MTNALILALAERIYVCSRLLTCAAERLGWDSDEVRGLVRRLQEVTENQLLMNQPDRARLRAMASILAYRKHEYDPETLALMWERYKRETEPEGVLKILEWMDERDSCEKGEPRS